MKNEELVTNCFQVISQENLSEFLEIVKKDVTISVKQEPPAENVIYRFNRELLKYGNAYFRSMFESGMKEADADVIEIPNVDSFGNIIDISIFDDFFHSVSGEINISSKNYRQLLDLAQLYQANAVEEACLRWMGGHVGSVIYRL